MITSQIWNVSFAGGYPFDETTPGAGFLGWVAQWATGGGQPDEG